MKLLFFSTFILLVNLASQDYVTELHKKLSPSIVSIEVDVPDEIKKEGILKRGIYYGTGFIVKEGFILTTRRVVQDQLVARCISYDNKIILGKVIAYDDKSPLVLMKTERFDLPPIPISENYDVGDVALSLGNTFGSITKLGENSISQGTVSGIYDYERWGMIVKNVVETDAAVNPGIYGGPIVNLDGAAIGIIFSGYSKVRFHGLSIAAKMINDFLSRYQNGEVYEPDSVFLLQVLPVYLGAKVQNHGLNSVKIIELEEDSPGQDSLQINDIILQIGEQEIKTVEKFHNTIQSYFPGQKISLMINRNNMVMVIPILLVSRFMR